MRVFSDGNSACVPRVCVRARKTTEGANSSPPLPAIINVTQSSKATLEVHVREMTRVMEQSLEGLSQIFVL
jgi:hypothetical protein